jgi:hypothetical protein
MKGPPLLKKMIINDQQIFIISHGETFSREDQVERFLWSRRGSNPVCILFGLWVQRFTNVAILPARKWQEKEWVRQRRLMKFYFLHTLLPTVTCLASVRVSSTDITELCGLIPLPLSPPTHSQSPSPVHKVDWRRGKAQTTRRSPGPEMRFNVISFFLCHEYSLRLRAGSPVSQRDLHGSHLRQAWCCHLGNVSVTKRNRLLESFAKPRMRTQCSRPRQVNNRDSQLSDNGSRWHEPEKNQTMEHWRFETLSQCAKKEYWGFFWRTCGKVSHF